MIPVLPVFCQKNTESVPSNQSKQIYSSMRANQSKRANQSERANQSGRINQSERITCHEIQKINNSTCDLNAGYLNHVYRNQLLFTSKPINYWLYLQLLYRYNAFNASVLDAYWSKFDNFWIIRKSQMSTSIYMIFDL